MTTKKIQGLITAIVTPFRKDGEIAWDNFEKLIEFQLSSWVDGILFVGTTGESPTISPEEHKKIIEFGVKKVNGRCLCLAGTGSNNLLEAMDLTEMAVQAGADAVLLVDPYYNGPSSREIMKEYILPIASAYPKIEIIPYIIPGRTGCELLPPHLAILHQQFSNINCVKIATGDLEGIKKTRELCGPELSILSGDDHLTNELMLDPEIKADGAISVMSNVFPFPLRCMIKSHLEDLPNPFHQEIREVLDLVNVVTEEETSYGKVLNKSRNPLPVKTIMNLLGIPVGPCRPPLGKMTYRGIQKITDVLDTQYKRREVDFKFLSQVFQTDTIFNLATKKYLESLVYELYE